MKKEKLQKELIEVLRKQIKGEVFGDISHRRIYATDASVYAQLPLVICTPQDNQDLKHIIDIARSYGISITPRTAGTSLAGQAIGEGIIVDLSKHFTQILEINSNAKSVRLQPGVIRDELNQQLRHYGLFFGPNTSTSNRCMMGGMVANNSSGTTSIKYGVTRDHILRVKGLLSDGSEVTFEPLDTIQLAKKCTLDTLEGKLYRHIRKLLENPEKREVIKTSYPKPGIGRRNTGYALDALVEMAPFTQGGPRFNMAKLIAGSEGTLMLITEIELGLSPLPPENVALICPHFDTLKQAMEAVPRLMRFNPYALEMMDRKILQCTIGHSKFEVLRDWVVGDPYAVLMLELRGKTPSELQQRIDAALETINAMVDSYAYPVLRGEDKVDRAWTLRKAGLGLLANLPGDAKAVACIEDTAVHVEDLKDYILEFKEMIGAYDQDPVYFAHAGAGELHIRPVLNLKDPEDVRKFRKITEETAHLVKKYNGSLSGEHGDGRVRGEFIPIVLGEEVYQMLKSIKETWDPEQIFNRGKITNTPPMDQSLRTHPGRPTPTYATLLSFDDQGGIVRAAEKCNGSGDCRRTAKSQALMCPSYMGSLEEYNTTRARANLLRTLLGEGKPNALSHPELKSILDLCLSCKGCLSECPSSVDMAALKAEISYHYYQRHRRPIQDIILGHAARVFSLSSMFPRWTNTFMSHKITSKWIKRLLHIHPERSIPPLSLSPIHIPSSASSHQIKEKYVWILADEFTRYHDPHIIQKALHLLSWLGYVPKIAPIKDSARSQLSKGYLKEAASVAEKNIRKLKDLISYKTPLLGIDPSTILGFRDEYPKLLRGERKEQALEVGKYCWTIDEWLLQELRAGNLRFAPLNIPDRHILVHTHCHQKSLGLESDITEQLLLHIPQLHVERIPSGCCGMAGSFGYDKDKYELSMSIGELVLLPTVRQAPQDALICANGTSCRHQIKDGSQRKAFHVIEILHDLMKDGIPTEK